MNKVILLLGVFLTFTTAQAKVDLGELYQAIDAEVSTVFYLTPTIISTKRVGGFTCSQSYIEDENGKKISEFSYNCRVDLSGINFGILYDHLKVEVANKSKTGTELTNVRSEEKVAGGLRCKKTTTLTRSDQLINEEFHCHFAVGKFL